MTPTDFKIRKTGDGNIEIVCTSTGLVEATASRCTPEFLELLHKAFYVYQLEDAVQELLQYLGAYRANPDEFMGEKLDNKTAMVQVILEDMAKAEEENHV